MNEHFKNSHEKEFRSLWNADWKFCRTALQQKQTPPPSGEWEDITLPHDWLIFDTENLYADGIGWYKKTMTLPEHPTNAESVLLYFDGVYMDSSLFVNGELVGQWKYGYTSFYFDITKYLKAGENEVLVKVVHQAPNSRWYSGAGIYRNVWLQKTPSASLIPDGTYFAATHIGEERWEVVLSAEVVSKLAKEVTVRQILRDKDGHVLGETTAVSAVKCNELLKTESKLTVEQPSRWDITNPVLYSLETTVECAGNVVDTHLQQVGFREVEFSPNQGLLLNGRVVKIQGVCEHHSQGALGAAYNPVASRRQLKLLLEMGINAIRTAHNPPAKQLMEQADELGILICSEAFDTWTSPKNPYDYARFFEEWHKKDVASWVRRDRNHPSLFLWSIGNEIVDTHRGALGLECTKTLAALVGKHDPARAHAVTFGSNHITWENTQRCGDVLKIVGYNYSEILYHDHHQRYPDWTIWGSETSSMLQSRGIYHFPKEQAILVEEDLQCSSLGNSATSWGAKSLEQAIIAHRKAPFTMGQFIWTGFDYLGEPTPYTTKNSYFGQLDTAGFPKDSFYVYQAEWTDYRTNPMVHIFPYWDFSPGQTIDVCVCSNAPKVELWLNGTFIGRYEKDFSDAKNIMGTWKVPYQIGMLHAIAYNEQGNIIAEDSQASFGDTTQLLLTADKKTLLPNSDDLLFLEISALDQGGHLVQNANQHIVVDVIGDAELLGLDNGNSADYSQFKGQSKRLFSGKLLAMVGNSKTEEPIIVKVSSPQLPTAIFCINGEKTIDISSALSTPDTQEIPIRKITLLTDGVRILDQQTPSVVVRAEISPPNATYRHLDWRITDKAGLPTTLATLTIMEDSVLLTAVGNGIVYLRCGTTNGGAFTDLYSTFDFTIQGLEDIYKDPYELINASLFQHSNGTTGRGHEQGIATLAGEAAQLTYTQINFGEQGSMEITIYTIPTSESEFTVGVWNNQPKKTGSKLLGEHRAKRASDERGYQADTIYLTEPLQGIQSLGFAFSSSVHFKGFRCAKTSSLHRFLSATSYDSIYGDSYRETTEGICDIGNNVSVVFSKLDLGETGASTIKILGKTTREDQLIQLRFLSSEEEIIHNLTVDPSSESQWKEFPIPTLVGKWDLHFIFLPGSQFDFYGFELA